MAEENPFEGMGQDLGANEEAEQQAIPRRRSRRRGRREAMNEAEQQTSTQAPASSTVEAEAGDTVSDTKPLSPEEQVLEDIFGPVDKDMTKIANVELTDIYPADDDPTGGRSWLMLEFEYTPTVSAFGLQNSNFKVKPQTGRISLNTLVLKDPSADRDHREYIPDDERKKLIDATIDYAFGKKFGIHRFEDLDAKFNEMLDNNEKPTFDVYQSVFPVGEGENRQYRTTFRLINRHQTSTFIQTDYIGEDIYKESVMCSGHLPVRIVKVNDNLNTYTKTDSRGTKHVYPFAQIELYVKYVGNNATLKGKTYLIRYKYLNTKEDGQDIPQEKQTPNFSKRLSQYMLIADKLGLHGDNKSLIAQIEALKDIDTTAKVFESSLPPRKSGEHKGDKIYYMKLN